MRTYDLISGLAGLGAYLLRRGRAPDTLSEVLSCLIQLPDTVSAHGHRVPGWWSPDAPSALHAERYPRGHFNLGMAHGIAGPLALLALAWSGGIRLPSQPQAMRRIARWLLSWQQPSDHGPWWPGFVSFEEEITRQLNLHSPRRPSWCYGSPGIAHALHLAGLALDEPDWEQAALHGMHASTTDPRQTSQLVDFSLCHGWAGLLHTTWRMAHASGDPRLFTQLPHLTQTLLRGFDPTSPFALTQRTDRPGPLHRAGFLEGAAGVALALHTLAHDRPPNSNWDTALLLA